MLRTVTRFDPMRDVFRLAFKMTVTSSSEDDSALPDIAFGRRKIYAGESEAMFISQGPITSMVIFTILGKILLFEA